MLFLDIETTGVDSETDEILSIAIVNDRGAVLLNTYVMPTKHKSWPEAMEIHNITPERIFQGNYPTMQDLAPMIIPLLEKQKVCAYNAEFDIAFIVNSILEKDSIDWKILRLRLDVVCCMDQYAIYRAKPSDKPYHKTGYKPVKLLKATAATGHIWTGKAHGALADAQACRHVWQWIQLDASRKLMAALFD
jgi:DNA polymerase III epsilon subunit-like protein